MIHIHDQERLNYALILLLTATAYAQQQPLQTFPLTDVRLLEGPFKAAQQTDMNYMLSLEPDRLLVPFLREAGLPTKAASYGNWENTGLDGHIGGHYLSALSLMYASTGEERVKQKLDYMIDSAGPVPAGQWRWIYRRHSRGKAMWKDVAAGKIDAGAFSLNNKWVPLYNIHKLYAGLYDAWTIAGNQKAKILLVDLCNWCVKLVSGLSDAQVQQMLRSEHGGLNEAFADVLPLQVISNTWNLPAVFPDRRILDPLVQQKDALTGLHANTQIPK